MTEQRGGCKCGWHGPWRPFASLRQQWEVAFDELDHVMEKHPKLWANVNEPGWRAAYRAGAVKEAIRTSTDKELADLHLVGLTPTPPFVP